MRLPDAIELEVQADGEPRAGVWVDLQLVMTRKNAFNSSHGPSDARGRLTIHRSVILEWARLDKQMFIMDYGDEEADWAGFMRIQPMGRAALQRALGGIREWEKYMPYPEGYADGLRAASKALEATPVRRLEALLVRPLGPGVTLEFLPAE